MSRAELISTLALLVSLGSFANSMFSSWRDRARLHTSCKFVPYWDCEGSGVPAHVKVSVVNAGRRPIILRLWVGAESKENWIGRYLGDKESGLRLAEQERHDLNLERKDLFEVTPDGDVLIGNLWFEDTLGRRHLVKDAKTSLEKLLAS